MPGTWETLVAPWPPGMTPDNGLQAVHMVHLKTGKVLLWGFGAGGPISFSTVARLWDPDDPSVSEGVDNDTTDLFCAGHSALTDGRTLIAGGGWYAGGGFPWKPPKDVNVFDPGPETWRSPPFEMEFRRWYPTCTTLWDGRVLITSGYKLWNQTGNPPVGHRNPDRLSRRAVCAQQKRLFPTRACVKLERAKGSKTRQTEVCHETMGS